jgi:hypothetical protein
MVIHTWYASTSLPQLAQHVEGSTPSIAIMWYHAYVPSWLRGGGKHAHAIGTQLCRLIMSRLHALLHVLTWLIHQRGWVSV